MSILTPFLCLFLPFLLALGLTGAATWWLKRRQVLDRPNERSSHVAPTPRGGGLGVVPALLGAWVVTGLLAGDMDTLWPVVVAALALATVSWADDLASVPPGWRLLAQVLAVAVGLSALPSEALVFQGWLPHWLDRFVAGLAWVWFVNLFNFMDGIDGISAVETLCLGLGLAAAYFAAGLMGFMSSYALALAGVALGFIAWNWHPARVFLGDVGSVPLGFLSGWLLLRAAGDGLWLPALILPLYYLTDATVTLARRLWRREPVWQAHRQHFYQQAVRRLGRHDLVALAILAANAALAATAILAFTDPSWVVAAPVTVIALLAWMAQGKAKANPDGGTAS
ncbi:MraY family glycosyltransferase [Nitrospirillum iridis]|uniref:UDP-N-acetylmuramyl pentapeptide phosphotransferase/UDP-N-acetylglucosamine-1-phosphate transferase n=1 Tax=Nitrospirillum iridis TaxID=765888 RepID=A0A7X0B3M4_9PROT|nr:glycosyltransferase family 4 protein [Nitrospirillum iridis]MBB6254762.1 UDP-N-acetylmuramyl pentapeptide phosphotransferase/UDP-N-acetylglucosamine-1-phosphate transferase [Nitrospirillum iridis]